MVAHYVTVYIARTTDEEMSIGQEIIWYPWYPGFEKSRSEEFSLSRSQLVNCIGRPPGTAPVLVL